MTNVSESQSQDLFHTRGRHSVAPRTLCFIFNEECVLLLRGGHRKWFAGWMNGVGGHVEAGESVLAAAHREVSEETGLEVPNLNMRAVLHSCAPDSAVMMFVFTGTASARSVRQPDEGILEWVPLDRLGDFPVLDDIAPILARLRDANGIVFGTLQYDAYGRLTNYQFEESCVSGLT